MAAESASDHVLTAQDIAVAFQVPRMIWQGKQQLLAVRQVSFALKSGEVLGVVGESGSGKSTLARALMRLVPVVRGTASLRCRHGCRRFGEISP